MLRLGPERIRVGGVEVGDDELVAAFERIERARGSTTLTFFEYNALAALLILSAAGATDSYWRLSALLRRLEHAQGETREQLRGALLAQALVRRRAADLPFALAGTAFLLRSATNQPLERLIGASVPAVEIEKTIDVQAPLEQVF